MFTNKIFIVLASFVLGFTTNYMYNNTIKNTKAQEHISTKIFDTDKISEKEILNKKIIPIFIQNSLYASGINLNNLSQKSWNEFLNKVQMQGLGKFVSSKRNGGYTLIHTLSQVGAIDIVKELVGKGFDINAKTDNGNTPLLLATQSMNLEDIKELVGMGADIDAQSNYGRDVLASAFQHENTLEREKIIKYLMEEQGFNFKDNPEKYLKYMASAPDGNKAYVMEVLPYLSKKNYAKSIKTIFEYGKGDDKMIDFFISSGEDIDINSLNYITRGKNVSTQKLEYMVQKYNLDINKGDDIAGLTPLMHAVHVADTEKVEFYLNHGANLEVTNKKGQNVFHVIAAETPRYPLAPKEEIEKIKNLLNKYRGRS